MVAGNEPVANVTSGPNVLQASATVAAAAAAVEAQSSRLDSSVAENNDNDFANLGAAEPMEPVRIGSSNLTPTPSDQQPKVDKLAQQTPNRALV